MIEIISSLGGMSVFFSGFLEFLLYPFARLEYYQKEGIEVSCANLFCSIERNKEKDSDDSITSNHVNLCCPYFNNE